MKGKLGCSGQWWLPGPILIQARLVWVYDKYEDALKAFVTKFKQIYKAQANKTYKNKAKLDLKSIFEESKSQNSAMANGRRVLDEATNVASQRLILRLKRPSMV